MLGRSEGVFWCQPSSCHKHQKTEPEIRKKCRKKVILDANLPYIIDGRHNPLVNNFCPRSRAET